MEVIILGCGTSTGVPVVGCPCAICRSSDPKNKRMRTSAAVRLDNGKTILIDTSPDLRRQALDNDLTRVDAVFYTHTHADHTHGIDEIRVYNFIQRMSIDVYGVEEHIAHIRRQFAYIFQDTVKQGGGKPQINCKVVRLGEAFELFGARITPIELCHGKLLSVGWRIGDFAYLTDLNAIPEASMELLRGVDTVVLGALRWRPHDTHFTIDEAVEAAKRLGARRTWLTHMSHDVDWADAASKLPETIQLAWDSLRFSL